MSEYQLVSSSTSMSTSTAITPTTITPTNKDKQSNTTKRARNTGQVKPRPDYKSEGPSTKKRVPDTNPIIEACFNTRDAFVDTVMEHMLTTRSDIASSDVDNTVDNMVSHLLHETAISWCDRSGVVHGGMRAWLMEKLVRMWEKSHNHGLVFTFGDWAVDTTGFNNANLQLLNAGQLNERLF